MAFRPPHDRVKLIATSWTSSAIELPDVAAPGCLLPQEVYDQGDSTWYCAGKGQLWMVFEGELVGTALQVKRVETNSNLDTSPIDFGVGGTLDVYTTLPGVEVVLRSIRNVFETDQVFRGRMMFGPDDRTYWLGSGQTAQLAVDDAWTLIVRKAIAELIATGDGVEFGPRLQLRRTRQSPGEGAAMGALEYTGTDSNQVEHVLAAVRAAWSSPDAGNPRGRLDLGVVNGGAWQQLLSLIAGHSVWVQAVPLIVGRAGASTIGAVAYPNGQVQSITNDTVNFTAERATDGYLHAFYQGGSLAGSIYVAGGTVSYNTFHGTHYSRAPAGYQLPEDTPIGAVLVADNEPYSATQPHLPCARLADRACDPAVYGTFAGWMQPDLPGYVPGAFLVSGCGMGEGALCLGPVRRGDLLVSSAEPGCAEAWQGAAAPPLAAVLGKVVRDDDATYARLVRCSAMGS